MDYLFVNLFTESISFVLYELVALQQGENPAQKKDQAVRTCLLIAKSQYIQHFLPKLWLWSSLKQFLTESQIGCKRTWTETRIMTSFHHIQRVPPPCCGRTFCTQCSWSNMEEKKFRAPSLSTGIRVGKKKTTTTTIVFLSQLDLFLLEKNRHFVTCT